MKKPFFLFFITLILMGWFFYSYFSHAQSSLRSDLVIESPRVGGNVTIGELRFRPDQLWFRLRNQGQTAITGSIVISFQWINDSGTAVGESAFYTHNGELGTSRIISVGASDRVFDGDAFEFDSNNYGDIDSYIAVSNKPEGATKLRIAVDPDNVISEVNENNNTISIIQDRTSDLEIVSARIVHEPNEISSYRMVITVRNNGPEAISNDNPGSSVAFFWLGENGQRHLSSPFGRQGLGAFAVGESKEVVIYGNESWHSGFLLHPPAGASAVRIEADDSDRMYENGFEENNIFDLPVTEFFPDLVMENPREGGNVTIGELRFRPDQLFFRARNIGQRRIDSPIRITFQWVDADNSAVGPREVFIHEGGLGTSRISTPAGSYDRVFNGDAFEFDSNNHTSVDSFVSSENKPAGAVKLRLTLDPDNEIAEISERNNILALVQDPISDLEVVSARIALNPYRLIVTVRNNGPEAISSDARGNGLAYSWADSAGRAMPTELFLRRGMGAFAVGESREEVVDLSYLDNPPVGAAGIYIKADDSDRMYEAGNESNNEYLLTPVRFYPDFIFENPAVGGNVGIGELRFRPDELFFRARNIGQLRADGPVIISFQWINGANEAAGEGRSFTLEGGLGTSIFAGSGGSTYFSGEAYEFDSDEHPDIGSYVSAENKPDGAVKLRITLDSDNSVEELRENNNSLSISQLPTADLEVVSARIAENPYRLIFLVKNNGIERLPDVPGSSVFFSWIDGRGNQMLLGPNGRRGLGAFGPGEIKEGVLSGNDFDNFLLNPPEGAVAIRLHLDDTDRLYEAGQEANNILLVYIVTSAATAEDLGREDDEAAVEDVAGELAGEEAPRIENTRALCGDAFDNDEDGLVDLADTDCSDFAAVGANRAPVLASCSANPVRGASPLATVFRAEASDPDGDSLVYVWNVGTSNVVQGSDSRGVFNYTYRNPGTYTTSLRVTDLAGLSSEERVCGSVAVESPPVDLVIENGELIRNWGSARRLIFTIHNRGSGRINEPIWIEILYDAPGVNGVSNMAVVAEGIGPNESLVFDSEAENFIDHSLTRRISDFVLGEGHELVLLVDPVLRGDNRIVEEHEDNNTFTIDLASPAACSLVVTPSSVSAVEGAEILFRALLDLDGPASFFGEEDVTAATSTTWTLQATQVAANLGSGRFRAGTEGEATIHASNSANCLGVSASAALSVAPVPNDPPSLASCSIEPVNGRAPLSVRYSSEASDPDNDTLAYRWNFGLGVTEQSSSGNFTYTSPGTYSVNLQVRDPRGNLSEERNCGTAAVEPPQTDLVIENASFVFGAYASANRLAFVVRNRGQEPISQPIYVETRSQGIGTQQHLLLENGLAAGESRLFDSVEQGPGSLAGFARFVSRSATIINLTVDPLLRGENRIIEENEDNNSFPIDLSLPSSCSLTIEPERASVRVGQEAAFGVFYDPDGADGFLARRNVAASSSLLSISNRRAADYVSPGVFRGREAGETSIIFSYSLCSGGATAYLTVTPVPNDPPQITSCFIEPLSGRAPLAVRYSSEAADPDGDTLTYRWNFGNDAVRQDSSGSFTYNDPGTYSATLRVEDSRRNLSEERNCGNVVVERPGVDLDIDSAEFIFGRTWRERRLVAVIRNTGREAVRGPVNLQMVINTGRSSITAILENGLAGGESYVFDTKEHAASAIAELIATMNSNSGEIVLTVDPPIRGENRIREDNEENNVFTVSLPSSLACTLTLSPSSASVFAGSEVNFRVLHDADGPEGLLGEEDVTSEAIIRGTNSSAASNQGGLFRAQSAGQVSVSAAFNTLCSGITARAELTVNPLPNNSPELASCGVEPQSGYAPLSVHFDSSASDPENDSLTYLWNFGTGETAGNPSGDFSYEAAGSHGVTLRVRDSAGHITETRECGRVTVENPPPPTPPSPTTQESIDEAVEEAEESADAVGAAARGSTAEVREEAADVVEAVEEATTASEDARESLDSAEASAGEAESARQSAERSAVEGDSSRVEEAAAAAEEAAETTSQEAEEAAGEAEEAVAAAQDAETEAAEVAEESSSDNRTARAARQAARDAMDAARKAQEAARKAKALAGRASQDAKRARESVRAVEERQEEKPEAVAADVGILPGNPLYIFKSAGRGLRSFVTRNPEKKAALHLRYANEKILEANALADRGNTARMARHLESYENDIRKATESLARVSGQNPEAGEKLAAEALRQEVKQQLLFGKFERKVSGENFESIRDVRERTLEHVGDTAAQISNQVELKNTLENAAVNIGGTLRSISSVEVIRAIEEKAPEAAQETLRAVRESAINRARNQISALPEESAVLSTYMENIGGNEIRHAKTFDELKLAGLKQDVREKVENVKDGLYLQISERIKESGNLEKIKKTLSPLNDGTVESIRIIHDVEKTADLSQTSFIAEVKKESLLKFGQNLDKLDTAEKKQKFVDDVSSRLSDVKQLGVLEGAKENLSEKNKDIISNLQSKSVLVIKKKIEERASPEEKQEKIRAVLADDSESFKTIKKHEGVFGKKTAGELISSQVKLFEEKFEEKMETAKDSKSLELLQEAVKSDAVTQSVIKEANPELLKKIETFIAPAMPTVSPSSCPADYKPVCGSNNTTYENECLLKQKGIGLQYYGECKAAAPTATTCPTDYKPVCGSNSKTYTNECVLKQAGVSLQYFGECKVVTPLPSTTACPTDYKPVCGTNNTTYTNECVLKQKGIGLQYYGECKVITTPPPTTTACPTDYKPVCGIDAKTYTNECLANQNAVKVDYYGECKITSTTITPTALPDLYLESPAFKPISPVVGDRMEFSAFLKNIGTAEAGASVARLRLDIGSNGTWDITLKSLVSSMYYSGITSYLNVGWKEDAEAGVSPPWIATAGTHIFEICADAGAEVKESNENNNCVTSKFTVGEKTTISTTSLPQCSDGLDNDKDGYVDLKDAGCIDSQDNDETNAVSTTLLPDLVASLPALSPLSPYGGDSVSFSATVENAGSGSSAASVARLRLDLGADGNWDVWPDKLSVSALGYGGLETKIWKYIWTATAGTHISEICIDPDDAVKETDNYNNCVTKKFTVAEKTVIVPPPTLVTYQCGDGADNDKDGYVDLKDPGCIDTQDNDEYNAAIAPTPVLTPDLLIQTPSSNPSLPYAGDYMSFNAIVKNQGSGSAGASTAWLRIDVNNDGTWDVLPDKLSVLSLASSAQENKSWSSVWKATEGTHIFEICADAGQQVSESNETNNCVLTKFSVAAAKVISLPDYTAESSLIAPTFPVSGTKMSFSATIKNIGTAIGAGSSFSRLRIDFGNDGKWDLTPADVFTDYLEVNAARIAAWKEVWAATQGTHKYEICADNGNLISESNETNNCVSTTFTIK